MGIALERRIEFGMSAEARHQVGSLAAKGLIAKKHPADLRHPLVIEFGMI
jgi:hypothetical protein